jgi:hypothetical protein
MSKAGSPYDRDFVLWTEEQSALLRSAQGSNLPLDWLNLAEEIESLGKSDCRALTSPITRILRHLLKLAVSPATEPRAGWQESIEDARGEIEILLADSPSLRREVDELIRRQGPVAARRAAADRARQGEPTEKVWARLESGGFTAEEVLGDWFPEPPG